IAVGGISQSRPILSKPCVDLRFARIDSHFVLCELNRMMKGFRSFRRLLRPPESKGQVSPIALVTRSKLSCFAVPDRSLRRILLQHVSHAQIGKVAGVG